MKKSLLLLIVFAFIGINLHAQINGYFKTTNMVISNYSVTSGYTPMQVAWDPALQLYFISTGTAQTQPGPGPYAVNPNQNKNHGLKGDGPSTSYISTYNANGDSLTTTFGSFNDRGLWYDPQTGLLEGNGEDTLGYGYFNLSSNGDTITNFTSYVTGNVMPANANGEAAGAYDTINQLVLFFNGNDSIYTYNLMTGAPVDTFVLNLPAGYGAFNNNVIYTGIPGMEIGLYDYVNYQIDLFSYTTHNCTAIYTLPLSCPYTSEYGFSYANNMVWISDGSQYWYGYSLAQNQIVTLVNSTLSYGQSISMPSSIYNSSIYYISSDSSVVTISSDDTTLIAVGLGSCTITAESDNMYFYIPFSLTVNPDTITVDSITANNITYDASNMANLTGGVVEPAFPWDTLVLVQGTGTFATQNVGNEIPITAFGYSINGTATTNFASNYYLMQPTGLTADILPDTITITGVMANNQVYNGTTMDTLTGGSLSGVYTLTDTVNFNLGMGTFAWADTGTNIPVTTNIQLTGPEAGNYYLLQPMGLTANIAPEQLIIAANADSVELGYQDTVTTFTYTIVAGMLQGDDMLMGSLYCNLGDTVGQYGIEQGTLTAGPDYVITFDTAIFAITAVPTLMKAATVAAPSVYPNPTKGPVQIDAASGEVSIVSMDGTVLEKTNLNTKKGVDLTGKAAGVYFLILKTDTGTYQYKVIKQ